MPDEISLIDPPIDATWEDAEQDVSEPHGWRDLWPYGVPGLTVIGGVVLALVGWAALAQTPYGIHAGGPRMHALPADAECVSRVVIYNLNGWYQNAETVQTECGPVVIQYQMVGGHNAAQPDRIEVLETPRGLFARPMSADIADDGTLIVCLFEYVGG